MTPPKDPASTQSRRDAEHSRETILNAAETLFAQQGYEATSMQQIGEATGLSRSTPAYFFGSKERLYRAVLDRAMQAERDSIMESLVRLSTSRISPEALLVEAIQSYHDFLVQHPNFIRLMERESLTDGSRVKDLQSYLHVLQDGLTAIRQGQAQGGRNLSESDAAQLLLSIVALCWFPLAHATTFLQAMGIDANDPSFLEQRKKHIIQLLLNGALKP
jgi:TetR/AcrR family transcriptional regulator